MLPIDSSVIVLYKIDKFKGLTSENTGYIGNNSQGLTNFFKGARY